MVQLQSAAKDRRKIELQQKNSQAVDIFSTLIPLSGNSGQRTVTQRLS